MKKILVIFLMLFTFTGCSLSDTPTAKVEEYLDKYINLNDEVISDMDTTINNEELSQENLAIYKEILIRQYQNLKYEIKEEVVNNFDAIVTVNITVYDLYKTSQIASTYMNEHQEEFYDVNNLFDNELYTSYKLGEMLKTNEIINYDVNFYLTKSNGEWILKNPNREVVEKLHGLYDYSLD